MKLLLALAVLFTTPALAQTQYADSSGVYVGLSQFASEGTVGYRFGSGLDAGVRARYFGRETSRRVSGGPVVGLSRPLGSGFVGRVEGAVLYEYGSGFGRTVFSGGTAQNLSPYRFERLTEDVTATVSRSLGVVGSLRIRPTLGVYANRTQQLADDYPERIGVVDTSGGSAGVHVEFPLTFRVFGLDVAYVAAGRIAVAGRGAYGGLDLDAMRPYAGSGLRLNF